MYARTPVENRTSRGRPDTTGLSGRTGSRGAANPDPTPASPGGGPPGQSATDGVSLSPRPPRPEPWLEVVRQAVGTLRFGIVQVVVHDGQVTQVERTERLRFGKAAPSYDI